MHLSAAVFLKHSADFQHILRRADKRCRHNIKAVLHAEFQILNILFHQGRQVHLHPRQVYALAGFHNTAVDNLADNIRFRNILYLQFNQPVINQNSGASVYILRQVCIGHRNNIHIPLHISGGQGKGCILLQSHLILLEGFHADFGPLCIQNQGDGGVQLLSRLFQLRNRFRVGFVCPVGKIDSRGIHTVLNQLLHNFHIICCRPQCADNFRFSHIAAPPFFCRIFSFQLEIQSNRKNFDYIVNFGV